MFYLSLAVRSKKQVRFLYLLKRYQIRCQKSIEDIVANLYTRRCYQPASSLVVSLGCLFMLIRINRKYAEKREGEGNENRRVHGRRVPVGLHRRCISCCYVVELKQWKPKRQNSCCAPVLYISSGQSLDSDVEAVWAIGELDLPVQ